MIITKKQQIKYFSDDEFIEVVRMSRRKQAYCLSLAEKQVTRTIREAGKRPQEITETTRDTWAMIEYMLRQCVVRFALRNDDGELVEGGKDDIDKFIKLFDEDLDAQRGDFVSDTCFEINGWTFETEEEAKEVEKN